MQKRTTIILASAIAGVVGVAAVGGAVAGGKGYGEHRGWGHHGMHMGGHSGGWGHKRGHGMRHMIKNFAKRYDADKDGKISQAEIDTNRTEWHKKFDADGNGTLSLKEFEGLWLEAKRQRMVRAFQKFDTDGDAQMSLGEYTEPMAGVVERWDRNGDGVLSRDDRRRRGHGRSMDQGGSQAQ